MALNVYNTTEITHSLKIFSYKNTYQGLGYASVRASATFRLRKIRSPSADPKYSADPGPQADPSAIRTSGHCAQQNIL